jgi:hypothetical protein
VDFTGTWDIVSSPDIDDEYLRLGGAPYVTLRQNGEFVKGEFEIGVMSGTINGGAHSDFIDFGGNDEMEEGFGEGQATLEGERLTSSSGSITATNVPSSASEGGKVHRVVGRTKPLDATRRDGSRSFPTEPAAPESLLEYDGDASRGRRRSIPRRNAPLTLRPHAHPRACRRDRW